MRIFAFQGFTLFTLLRVFQLGIVLLLLVGCVLPIPVTGSEEQPASASLLTRATFDYLGQSVGYDLYVPPDYRQGWPIPLVVSIQDPDSTAEQQETITALASGVGSKGYLILYLRSPDGSQRWRYGQPNEPTADLDFFMALVRHLSIAWDVVPGRIYLIGMGQGAELAYVLGCTFANQFTAIALVAGQYPSDLDCQPSRPVSVLMIHGTQDPLMPFDALAPYQPVRKAAQTWATWNGCASPSTGIYTNGNVQAEGWSACLEKTEVILFSISGGKHTWPGSSLALEDPTAGELNATELVWQFFSTHTR